jgi:hypothetical protein
MTQKHAEIKGLDQEKRKQKTKMIPKLIPES